jgi:uncharacterized protein
VRKLTVEVRPGEYTVARLAPAADVPPGLLAPAPDTLVSVTRTGAELSVVCPTQVWECDAPDEDVPREDGWRLLTVRGPLQFTLTGIVAALSSELAAAGVGLFSLSTYDTDHLLVKESDLSRAVEALQRSGHEVHGAQ